MTIESEITRISNAKSDISSALKEKGIQVSETIDTYASSIRTASISGGNRQQNSILS